MKIITSFQEYISFYMGIESFVEPNNIPQKGDMIRLFLLDSSTKETDFDYPNSYQNYDITLKMRATMELRGANTNHVLTQKAAKKATLLDQFFKYRQHPPLEFDSQMLADNFVTNICGYFHSPVKERSEFDTIKDNLFVYAESWTFLLKTSGKRIM